MCSQRSEKSPSPPSNLRILLSLRPLKYRENAISRAPRRFRFRLPDRPQRFNNILRFDGGDGLFSERWEHISLKGVHPLLPMLHVSPLWQFQLMHLRGTPLKGHPCLLRALIDFGTVSLPLAISFGARVFALRDQHTVFVPDTASRGQRE